jgi:HEAT repeat protein
VGGVIPALGSPSRTVRTGAAAALAHAPLPKAKPPLKKLLADQEHIAQVMSGLALSVMGDKSISAPLKKLNGAGTGLNASAANWVVLSLALVGDKDASTKVDAMVHDESLPYASMQLPKVAKLVLPFLTKSLSPDSTLGSTRQGADWVLGTMARVADHGSVTAAIEGALKVPGQKMSALMAIVKMADPAASALAVPLLDDPDKQIQMAAGLAVIAASSTPSPKAVFWY